MPKKSAVGIHTLAGDTGHIAIIGKTGSGKTYAAKSFVEHSLQQGRHVCIIDPTGAWWGLRFGRDGRRGGFPILILGGEYGDFPLEPTSGEKVASLIAQHQQSLIADVSSLLPEDRQTWVADFASSLYRMNNRRHVLLVLDEAHDLAPQSRLMGKEGRRMLNAVSQIASGGRSRGIRTMMITQRPQRLHKDVLTSAETLVALKLIAPQDRGAVRAWIKDVGDRQQGKVVIDSLPHLPIGEGWVWCPSEGVLDRTRFPAIRTYDSSRTPVHDTGHIPTGRATLDLDLIRAFMQPAKDEEPPSESSTPSSAKIASLKAELAAANARADKEYQRGRADGMKQSSGMMAKTLSGLSTITAAAQNIVRSMGDPGAVHDATTQPSPLRPSKSGKPDPAVKVEAPAPDVAKPSPTPAVRKAWKSLSPQAQQALEAIVRHGPLRIRTIEAFITDKAQRNLVSNHLQELYSRILAHNTHDGKVEASEAGADMIRQIKPEPDLSNPLDYCATASTIARSPCCVPWLRHRMGE
jgi:hypothetical protein